MRERTDLDKKPTWFLFVFANVSIIIGCVVTWILSVNDGTNFGILFVPTLVCNIVALICGGFFMWLEAKETMPKAVHFRKKWLWWYLAAMIIFVVAIIYNVMFYCFDNKVFAYAEYNIKLGHLIGYLVGTGVLSLVSIGLQRYARYRIDLDIYRRKHGELLKKQEEEKEKAKFDAQVEKIKEKEKAKAKKVKEKDQTKSSKDEEKSIDKPTSGLLDKIDN